MYLVTGGAGFIGSNLAAELAARGESVVVCDWMGSDERWRNLAKHEIADVIAPEELTGWLRQASRKLRAVLHMGAVSTTTETDVDRIVRNNIRATFDLLEWCRESATPFIYASSAATYGDGESGFDDDFGVEPLARLRPLNAYGWSKHLVDRRVARLVEQGASLPPQWVGLKFFNVYGPNEYHKGTMRSVVARNFGSVRAGEPMRLFKSYRSQYADGGQLRDFIYVKDCVDVILWLLEHPKVSGLFNVGTGKARTWLDLAHALLRACGREPAVEFVEMPPTLADKYQYFTQARMQRLRLAGYERAFTSLEDGVSEYVQRYLATADPYR
ncbi:MAG TPA: ADP-glyceromanno-heptose 6-epimerase [Steroidobacteraceae bacterium]|jgi:ADP-L-glycero-D-manno-heptose 6-epimerase|nr:ADP-glyceromanno-heptose 6-epimerase [Steroidobacteraceae bacterium]